MPTTTYKLGRDCVATIPGVVNDDIITVTANVQGNQLDVTTFKATALTQWEYMAGLTDITIDVTCTNHDAAVGDVGACNVAGLGDGDGLEATVLEIKETVTPKGKVEYTVSYGLQIAED
jgi:hypothetical protein